MLIAEESYGAGRVRRNLRRNFFIARIVLLPLVLLAS